MGIFSCFGRSATKTIPSPPTIQANAATRPPGLRTQPAELTQDTVSIKRRTQGRQTGPAANVRQQNSAWLQQNAQLQQDVLKRHQALNTASQNLRQTQQKELLLKKAIQDKLKKKELSPEQAQRMQATLDQKRQQAKLNYQAAQDAHQDAVNALNNHAAPRS